MEVSLNYKKLILDGNEEKGSKRKQDENILFEFYQKRKIIQTRVYAGVIR